MESLTCGKFPPDVIYRHDIGIMEVCFPDTCDTCEKNVTLATFVMTTLAKLPK
jgi:hypothetical protein